MATVTITAQNIRLDDAESAVDWGNIGGGPGGALETDFKYQASNCLARKGATASRGIFLSDNVDSDLSGVGTYETVMFKFICTTPGLLDLLSVPGIRLEIGSGSVPATPSVNFHFYDVQGSDTYPLDKSWLILPVDPNIASHRTGTTGTPGLTVVDYYAMRYDQTAVSKSPNQAMDAVDIGAGLTLAGGDGADTDGIWQDFSDADWGTAANRYGYVREIDGAPGVFLIFGQMVIGTASATVFNDNNVTIIFPEGLFAAGFSGITIDLQNATTDVDLADSNFFGKGTEAGEDTRPTLTVTGTLGAFDTDNCVFDAFAGIILTSVCTLLNGKVTNSESITQAGAVLDGVEVTGATTADGVAFIVSNDPAKIKNCAFTFSDGHAIEITATGTYTFSGNLFTGYGADGTNDAAIFNDSGGAVTLNITGGGDTPTIRNGAGASTTVNNTVTVEVTGLSEGASAQIEADTGGPLSEGTAIGAFPLIADANGKASSTHPFTSDQPIVVRTRYAGSCIAAVQEDNSGAPDFVDFTTGSNDSTASNVILMPATEALNDAFYMGMLTTFSRAKFTIAAGQGRAGTWSVTWEYWNGTVWGALSDVVDGTDSFATVGVNTVTFTVPGDWASEDRSGQGSPTSTPLFFIRARISSFTSAGGGPTATKISGNPKRFLSFTTTGTITSTGFATVAVWLEDTIIV